MDVGHVIELYADFSLQGKHYAQFPDRQNYRIYLEELRNPDVRLRLHDMREDPQKLALLGQAEQLGDGYILAG